MVVIDGFPSIKVNLDVVAKRSGYPKLSDMPEHIKALLSEIVALAESLIEAKASVKQYDILKIESPRITLATQDMLVSKNLSEQLEGTTEVSILAVTIGTTIEERIEEFISESEVTRAFLLDSFASEAVEALADYLNNQLIQERKDSARATRRYSPGYGDLSLDSQRLILKLSDAENIGVVCNKYYILQPEKSITAIIGWIPVRS